MTNSRPSLSLPSLAAAALVILCTQAAFAQDAPRPAAATPAPAAAPAKTEATTAKEIAPAKETAAAATDAVAAPSPAKPTTAAPEKCACEVPDEAEPSATAEPAAAQGGRLFASVPAPTQNAAPELFPRAALRDDQSTGAQQQQPQPQQPQPQPQPQQNGAQWTPLSNGEKMKRAARNAFFSPIGVGRVLIGSAITQYNEDDLPHKTREDEFADFGSRFAINYSRRATRTLLGSGVYPILFNQDPRYDRADPDKGFAARAAHAVSRVIVQRGDNGKLQPAVSRWAGALSASAITNLWERSTPGHDRIGTDATFRRFGYTFINDSVAYLITEFWPDIAKIFGR